MSETGNRLSIKNLKVSFGNTVAVHDVSLDLASGASVALVGSNGAGKSTTLLAVAGGLDIGATTNGTILLDGAPAASRSKDISLVPEQEKVFMTLTVEDNLKCVSTYRNASDLGIPDVLGWFPRLAERRSTLAGNLSGGEQQMLAIGMALIGSPRLLLLDEPTLGLAVPIIEQLCETLARIRKEISLTVLVAEADSHWLPHLADSAYVIQRGRIIAYIPSDLGKHEAEIGDILLGIAPRNASNDSSVSEAKA
ncbi:MAG: ATP-binding cassette domain-containing protein [Rhizobiaceae bacterium]|nr:ATP-binding cassette domain-containing protein [Rhizobiaceae bacterium]